MRKKLLIGVFVGELGWEYLRYQGYFRRYARLNCFKEQGDECIAFTYFGHELFYHDFCSAVFSHESWLDGRREIIGPPHAFGHMQMSSAVYDSLCQYILNVVSHYYDHAQYDIEFVKHPLGVAHRANYFLQDFVEFSVSEKEIMSIWIQLEKKYLIPDAQIVCVFPRMKGDKRDWGAGNYENLIESLLGYGFGVVICGHPQQSFCTDMETRYGLLNLTEFPRRYILPLTICALAKSAFAFGGQSALPLISLGQGVPTVMWGCEPRRHSQIYNWRKTACLFLPSQQYDISPKEVLGAFFDWKDGVSRDDRLSPFHLLDASLLKEGEILPNEKVKR